MTMVRDVSATTARISDVSIARNCLVHAVTSSYRLRLEPEELLT